MTTNQTIDGVPRVLVEWMANAGDLVEMLGLCSGELRALLDAPSIGVCRDCFTEQPKGHACKTCAEVEAKRALLDADKVNNRQMGLMQFVDAHPIKSATQPQGEPVALTAVGVLRDDGDGGLEPEWILEGGTAELWAGAMLLIADEDQELCAEDGHCELYRAPAEQPAPVAVVLPDREMYCQYLRGVIPDNRLEVEAHKDGWNACLDELKRLNPSL